MNNKLKKIRNIAIILFFYIIVFILINLGINAESKYSSDMVAYWKFDENKGTVTYDSISNKEGIIYGANWTTGKVNSALMFNGKQYVLIPYNPIFDVKSELTIELWINKKQNIPYAGLVCRSDWHAYNLMFDKDGKRLKMEFVKKPGDSFESFNDDVDIPNDVWIFIVITYDDDINKLRFYINGNLTKEFEAAGDYKLTDTTNLYIGYQNYGERYFNGMIDEVAIYNRALRLEEIKQHYKNGMEGKGY